MDSNNWLDYLQAFGSIAVSIASFLLAFVIYRKVTFKKSVVERQFETVTDIIKVLEDFDFTFEYRNDDEEMSAGQCIPFFNITTMKDLIKKYKNIQVYYTYDFYENLPFLHFAKYPFTPIKIADAIESFLISIPNANFKERYTKYLIIDFRRNNSSGSKSKTLIYNEYTASLIDLESFCNTWFEMHNEIQSWLLKYDAKDLNLR